MSTTLKVSPKLKQWLIDNNHSPATLTSDDGYATRTATLLADGRLSVEQFESLSREDEEVSSETTDKLFAAKSIEVKKPSAQYSTKRYAATHARTNQTMFSETGQEVTKPSEQSFAKTGALIKHLASKAGVSCQLTEHERELLLETAADDEWAGDLGGDYFASIKDVGSGRIKALLDDSTSGGLEIAPISFDSDVVSTPQLSGELWPFTDIKPISRGRRIEGAAISNITVTSGHADAQEMALFTTDDLISALDTTIFACVVAIEVGRDFLSDAAVDVGRLVTQEIGNSMASWLDEQVAIGDGTTEPEGVLTASGTTTVNFGGATSISNYESLLFSVPKAQRGPVSSPSTVFCSNETTYQRARAIPVGAADARRIFGMTHEDFMLLSRPYKISTDLSNQQLFFGDLKKWRGYRRTGLAIEVHTQGSYLARRNLALITARMRVGGRVVLPSSFGVVSDAPA